MGNPSRENPQGIDTLESFTAKFSRMQDTLMDKLLPLYLSRVGETTGTAIDNLNKAEKLGLIEDVNEWLAARSLRNRLVHEYIEDLNEMVEALQLCKKFVSSLLQTWDGFEADIAKRFDV